MRGARTLPLQEFLVGVKRNALEPDELIVAARVRVARGRETFMKVGPRNAMVIAVVSLAVRADPEARLAVGGVRLGRAGRDARLRSDSRSVPAFRSSSRPPRQPDRRRPRHGRVPPPRACAC